MRCNSFHAGINLSTRGPTRGLCLVSVVATLDKGLPKTGDTGKPTYSQASHWNLLWAMGCVHSYLMRYPTKSKEWLSTPTRKSKESRLYGGTASPPQTGTGQQARQLQHIIIIIIIKIYQLNWFCHRKVLQGHYTDVIVTCWQKCPWYNASHPKNELNIRSTYDKGPHYFVDGRQCIQNLKLGHGNCYSLWSVDIMLIGPKWWPNYKNLELVTSETPKNKKKDFGNFHKLISSITAILA